MKSRAAVLLVFCSTLALATTEGQQSRPAARRFTPDEIIVRFQPAVSAPQGSNILGARSARSIRRFRAFNTHLVRLNPGQRVDAAIASLSKVPGVASVQPNYIRHTTATAPPNDLYWTFDFLWGLQKIGAQEIWTSLTTGDPEVVVASIDTGVNYNHPDLADNMWRNPSETPGNNIDDDNNGYVDDVFGIDTANGDGDPFDDHGHGTHTTGTIAAVGNNGTGVVGVSWKNKVLSCKFTDAQGIGTDAAAIECFDYLVALKQNGVNIRVSNNSWGEAREEQPATALQSAIDEAGAFGILHVFGAGNDGTNNDIAPFDPASFTSPSIIAVAASDQADNRAGFSNYGFNSVDLAAPGVSILSTLGGSYGFSSGTSMAAPHVAGTAALLFSLNPSLSVEEAKALLIGSVDPVPQWSALVLSGGRLNAFAAAAGASGNTPPSIALTNPTDGATFTTPSGGVLEAQASDAEGSIHKVDFYANGALVGTDTNSPYAIPWTINLPGSYTLTAVATDNVGARGTSSPVHVTVLPQLGRVNVALAANGATVVASSTNSGNFPASGAINGDRLGLVWLSGTGGWADNTWNSWPDWLEVRFNGLHTIGELDVVTLQDNYTAPIEPTPTTTFSQQGIQDFTIQYWTGTTWQTVPGTAVTGNTMVWRQFYFAPISTSRIRVHITKALQGLSRIIEVEAWTATSGANAPPTVALTSPAGAITMSAPASLSLEATASDADGTVSQVDFYINGTLIGTDTSGPYLFPWSTVLPGSYTLTAVATDNLGARGISSPAHVTVVPPLGRVNVALATSGATAVASSTNNGNFPASGAINGDRLGLGWLSGTGGWADNTWNSWPDWLEVRFNGLHTIGELDVVTLQDNYTAPIEPTPTTTFSQQGIQDFTIQYWTGTTWQTVPGTAVTANALVWRQFYFAPISTSRIRVHITKALQGLSRIIEVEAWTATSGANAPPTVALTSPSGAITVSAPASLSLEATASDAEGTVSQVDFYVNGTLVGSDTTNPYVAPWSTDLPGNYTLTAVATDNLGARSTSNPVQVTVVPPPGRLNVALALNGATAVASTTNSGNFQASGAMNGDRRGLGWLSGTGGWADNTWNSWPDWLEIRFNGLHTIGEVDVVTLQDNYTAPIEPTPATTFSQQGIQDFTIQVLDRHHMADGAGDRCDRQLAGVASVLLRADLDFAHSRAHHESPSRAQSDH